MPYFLFFFPFIIFLAFVVKTITGFGSAIILVALGSFYLAPAVLLPVSSILDGIAGFFMLSVVNFKEHWRFWRFPGLMMMGGSVSGGFLLQLLPISIFHLLLNFFLVGLSFWFIRLPSYSEQQKLIACLPATPTLGDLWMSFLGGVCGGLLGMSGPPLIWHFGRKFSKEPFRQAMVPILLIGSISRFLTYIFLEFVNQEIFFYLLFAIPGMVSGIWFGNFLFHRISERRFRQMIGVFLIGIVLLNLFKK